MGQLLVRHCRKQPGKLKVVQLGSNSLVPRLSLRTNEKFRMESWAGLGNEARIAQRWTYDVKLHLLSKYEKV